MRNKAGGFVVSYYLFLGKEILRWRVQKSSSSASSFFFFYQSWFVHEWSRSFPSGYVRDVIIHSDEGAYMHSMEHLIKDKKHCHALSITGSARGTRFE